MKGPIPNYLKYGFKTTEVAKIYQKEYVPEIQEYIQNQLKEDYMADQISLKEYIDPFTGEK